MGYFSTFQSVGWNWCDQHSPAALNSETIVFLYTYMGLFPWYFCFSIPNPQWIGSLQGTTKFYHPLKLSLGFSTQHHWPFGQDNRDSSVHRSTCSSIFDGSQLERSSPRKVLQTEISPDITKLSWEQTTSPSSKPFKYWILLVTWKNLLLYTLRYS